MPQHLSPQSEVDAASANALDVSRRTLVPKGSCWYCEKPVGDIRRFCGKACATAFEEEKEFHQAAIAQQDPGRK
jgi:predicted nucleic acid-binding Zn ribbon protein